MSKEVEEIALPEAAQRLGISWHRAWRLVLTGSLRATRDPGSGKWLVSRASLDEFIEKRGARAGSK